MSNESGFGFGTSGAAVVEDVTLAATDSGSGFEFVEPAASDFPPRITPGPVKFRFEVHEVVENEPRGSVQVNAAGKVPVVRYNAHVLVGELASARMIRPITSPEATIRFNEASAFKSPAMKNYVDKNGNPAPIPSDLERLYSALGLRQEFGVPKSLDAMVEMIRNSNGRIVEASLGWEAVTKLAEKSYERYSTSPNAKRGDKPWPVAGEGQPMLLEVTFSNGETKVGRERIFSLRTPRTKKSK